jgi:hypothetical protein
VGGSVAESKSVRRSNADSANASTSASTPSAGRSDGIIAAGTLGTGGGPDELVARGPREGRLDASLGDDCSGSTGAAPSSSISIR